MDILQDLFLMDGQGKYVWFVVAFFLITILVNLYLPYKQIKLIKKQHSQTTKE
ncbi:MAG: hypothetical protein QF895_00340 [SAR86 cluster bacterium]|nr:hypothetical protein [SAR86 cluster bacterium]